MKTNHPFVICVFILSLWGIVGCTEIATDKPETKEITVALKLTGDYGLEVEQDPLTKGSSNDAYGINVYYDKESDGNTNDHYAYGLFDNVPAMSITLISNHKYRFQCGLVKNAKNDLFYGQAFGNSFSGYAYPFQTNNSSSTPIGNTFNISNSNVYLSGIGYGQVHLANNTSPSTSNATKYAGVNRYWGTLDNYVPVANGTVDIYLKRVVFGAKFVVSGLRGGSVKVSSDFYTHTYNSNDEGTEKLYSFPDGKLTSSSQNYDVTVTYSSSRGGTLWNLTATQTITFKRNVMTTVNINLSPDVSSLVLALTEEPLGDDNDINIGIDGNSLIDVDVNPN